MNEKAVCMATHQVSAVYIVVFNDCKTWVKKSFSPIQAYYSHLTYKIGICIEREIEMKRAYCAVSIIYFFHS